MFKDSRKKKWTKKMARCKSGTRNPGWDLGTWDPPQSLKVEEVKELFLNVKNFKSPKEVMKSFFGIKNFKTVMASFSELKTLRDVRQLWSFISVLKALRAVRM